MFAYSRQLIPLSHAFCSDLGGYHIFIYFLALCYRVPGNHSIERLDFTFCSKKEYVALVFFL